jgi:hypothetical protein
MLLLMGRQDCCGNLVIESSHANLSKDEITALVEQEASDGNAWAASFSVESHKEAIQRAYDEYVAPEADENTKLIDKVHGFAPVLDRPRD